MYDGVCLMCGTPITGPRRRYCKACRKIRHNEQQKKYDRANRPAGSGPLVSPLREKDPQKYRTSLEWVRDIAAINEAARTAGVSYGQYVAAMKKAEMKNEQKAQDC